MKYSMKKVPKNSIGHRLRITRKKFGVTAQELSEVIGIDRTTIVKLETGVNKNIHASKACLIAKYLGVSTDWIVMGWE